MRFFLVLLARRNIFAISHNRSTDSHARSDSQSLPRPTNVAGTKLRNTYGSASDQCRFDQRRNLSLVSAGRIYSHLEVLTQGISSGNRIVLTNTPNADITMCIIYIYIYIYIYEYTARCIHILNFAVTLYTLQFEAYTVVAFLYGPLATGHPDYTATFSLQ